MPGRPPVQTAPTLHLELTSSCQDVYVEVSQPDTQIKEVLLS